MELYAYLLKTKKVCNRLTMAHVSHLIASRVPSSSLASLPPSLHCPRNSSSVRSASSIGDNNPYNAFCNAVSSLGCKINGIAVAPGVLQRPCSWLSRMRCYRFLRRTLQVRPGIYHSHVRTSAVWQRHLCRTLTSF
jgi:hypothetical protein